MDALAISRALSFTVIVLSFFMKLPQVRAIYITKSSRGVNIRGYWMDMASNVIGASYGYYWDYHISTYGEAILLALQSAVIIYLAVSYGRLWSTEIAACAALMAVFVAVSLVKAIPGTPLYFLLCCTLPLAAGSKLAQIRELYRLKAQGDISIAMWGLAAYGCTARLFTVAVEVKDLQVFLNFLVSLTLNVVVVLQCLYYSQGQRKAAD